MAQTTDVLPVKFFVAILFRLPEALVQGKHALISRWGKIDYDGHDYLFDVTDYYEPEMGSPLYRRIVSFEELMTPTLLVDMKIACNQVERMLAQNGARIINLDAGYIDHHKVVLASAKGAGHKIYLDHGIWADLACRFKGGVFQPFEWSFPDFRELRYQKDLSDIRTIYLEQLKDWRINNPQ